MAHIQTTYIKLWKPQDINVDKVNSQYMFVDNVDNIESALLSLMKIVTPGVQTVAALKAIDTSDTTLYISNKLIAVSGIGIYSFNRNSTDADNGNTIIQPTTGGGRWICITTTNDATTDNSGLMSASDKIKLNGIATGAEVNQNAFNNIKIGGTTISSDSKLGQLVLAAGDNIILTTDTVNKQITLSVSGLSTHLTNISNPHSVTKTQVGLSNVPNVTTNNQTPTYTEAGALTALTSGEILSTAFGKIKKAVASLISHLADKTNPHEVTTTQLGAVPTTRTINSKALSSNILLTASDIGAQSVIHKSNTIKTGDWYEILRLDSPDNTSALVHLSFHVMSSSYATIERVTLIMNSNTSDSGMSVIDSQIEVNNLANGFFPSAIFLKSGYNISNYDFILGAYISRDYANCPPGTTVNINATIIPLTNSVYSVIANPNTLFAANYLRGINAVGVGHTVSLASYTAASYDLDLLWNTKYVLDFGNYSNKAYTFEFTSAPIVGGDLQSYEMGEIKMYIKGGSVTTGNTVTFPTVRWKNDTPLPTSIAANKLYEVTFKKCLTGLFIVGSWEEF